MPNEPPPPCIPDTNADQPHSIGDMRDEFERISRQVPRDPKAERDFIENKIEIIRSDPNLTESEKKCAIDELQR